MIEKYLRAVDDPLLGKGDYETETKVTKVIAWSPLMGGDLEDL